MHRLKSYLLLSSILIVTFVCFCRAGDKVLSIYKDKEGNIKHQTVEGELIIQEDGPDGKRAVFIDSSVGRATPDGPDDPGNGDDDEPTDPPGDPVAERAYNLAASLGSKQDAYSLSGFYQLFADLMRDGKATKEQVLESFTVARRIATVKELEADWSSAFESLDKEMEKANDLESWLRSVAKGLSKYSETSAAQVLTQNSKAPEEITDPDEIFRWIEVILFILKIFGIDVGGLG